MMRVLVPALSGLLALVAAIALWPARGAGRVGRQRDTAEVALLDCEGTPCIDASIGAGPDTVQRVRLAIDTGNVDSVIDTRVARAAGLQPIGAVPQGAPGGMFRTAIPEVRVGKLTLNVSQAFGMELSEMIERRQIPHVDGTLAYTAFADRVLELDFAGHQLRISAPRDGAAECGKGCGKMSLIPFGKGGPPILVAEGFAIGGRPVTAQVDTMYTGSLLVYTASIAKLGLSTEAKTEKNEMFPLTDGGVAMRVAPAKSETFDGVELMGSAAKVYFPTPDVHEPDGLFDATVGLALLQNAVVTLDFHFMTLRVQKPRAHP
jgi:hypothetical protein